MIAYIVFFSMLPAAICAFWSWIFGVSLDWLFYNTLTGIWVMLICNCILASYPEDR